MTVLSLAHNIHEYVSNVPKAIDTAIAVDAWVDGRGT